MLSENEYKILSLMWREGRPITRSEILKGTNGSRTWNPASIHLILNSMISKNVVKVTNEEITYGRTYEAALTYQEYLMETLKSAVPDKSLKEVFEDCQKCLEEWRKEDGDH